MALTKTQYILSLTHIYAQSLPADDRTTTDDELDTKDPDRKIRRMKGRELRIVQGQEVLRLGANDVFPNEICKMVLWKNFWE